MELKQLSGIAGCDVRPCKNGRVNFSLAVHPQAKVTVWVACFGNPSTPGITTIRKGDRVSLEGWPLEGDQECVNVRSLITILKPRRKAGNAPGPDWHEEQEAPPPDEQGHMEE